MTRKELRALLEGMAPAIKQHVSKQIDAAVGPLVDKIIELEQRPQLTYEGVWSDSNSYAAGSCVTWGGSLYIARSASIAMRPGNGLPWQLASKLEGICDHERRHRRS